MSVEWTYGFWLALAPLALLSTMALAHFFEQNLRRLSERFATVSNPSALPSRWSRFFIWLGRGLALFFLGLALADPRYGVEVEEVSYRGRDIVFVLDVSKSMLASDIAPSRLKRARQDIIDGVQDLGGHRLGLIAFAGQPKEVCPLTYDHRHFIQRLRKVDTSTVPMGGTNMGDALRMAVESLEAGADLGHHRDVVLITDGQDLTGYFQEIAKMAGSLGVSIYTVGIGQNSPANVVLDDGTLLKSEGQVVQTSLNAEPLKEISVLSQGFYQNLEVSPRWMQNILEVLANKEQREGESMEQHHKTPRFTWPLSLALFFWGLSCIVPHRRGRREA